MHADDILMLATNRKIAIEKVKCLMEYCKENYIRLQITKCSLINGKDGEDLHPITVENLTLNQTTSQVYLGSVIINSSKLIGDVNADIASSSAGILFSTSLLSDEMTVTYMMTITVFQSY